MYLVHCSQRVNRHQQHCRMLCSLELQLPNLLQKCTFRHLKKIHGIIITRSLHQNPEIRLKLLRRSTEFGSMEYASRIFCAMCADLYCPETSLWNAMIRGYAHNGPFQSCLKLFDEMSLRGIKPDNYTYPYVLRSCSEMGLLKIGQKVHCRILKTGFYGVSSVSDAIFKFYVKVVQFLDKGVMEDEVLLESRKVLDDMCIKPVEFWNILISEHIRIGDVKNARNLFHSMLERDVVSWNTMIFGYAKVGDVTNARDLFERMPEKNVVSWTTIIRAYAGVGDVETARECFDSMPERNVVSWNCMISSYTQNGKYEESLDLFYRMQLEGLDSDGYTFVSVLSACSHLGDLELGKWVHSLIRNWSQLAVNVGTALVEMYAKCGDIDKAFATFIKIGNKDVFCCNVMIKSLAIHGRAEDAIEIFYSMQKRGLKPNDITLSSALCACSHGCLVEEGRRIFHHMKADFDIRPNLEHYGCVIDLLCRNGLLEEAKVLVKEMPLKPDIAIWGALLNGCWLRDDLKSAESIIDKADKLKSDESGIYVLLSNINASTDQWLGAAGAREMMEEKSLWKRAGSSSVSYSYDVG